ncbi:MAG: hypothetical protein B6245_24290 [Desulfobacteraceae bacterium 4572_88]|nr:MAG: hypothetical protein B6245_24290 [Desulfobacteraceae bacterium 4572_88]
MTETETEKKTPLSINDIKKILEEYNLDVVSENPDKKDSLWIDFGKDFENNFVGDRFKDETVVNEDKTVVEVVNDHAKGLMWQKSCSDNQPHTKIQGIIDNLNKGKFKDWRLPTFDELLSLMEKEPVMETGSDGEPRGYHIDSLFRGHISEHGHESNRGTCWSSDKRSGEGRGWWIVYFTDRSGKCGISWNSRGSIPVRAVRKR